MEVAGANRRWRLPFRCRGSRRESAVAQLSTLGHIRATRLYEDFVSAFVANRFGWLDIQDRWQARDFIAGDILHLFFWSFVVR
jgi:hypothetical protein